MTKQQFDLDRSHRECPPDIYYSQLGTDGKAKQKYTFNYLWPTEISGIAVDWSSDAIQEYTVTFCYDYWTHAASDNSVPTS